MRQLTPPIIIKFQSTKRLSDAYQVVLKDLLDIVETIYDKKEIYETKLLLKEAVAILENKEGRIWAQENGY